MKKNCLFALLALVCGTAPVPAAPVPGKADLVGTVSSDDGKPIRNATIVIYTAAPKQGVSILCPSCYVDCGKRAQTDAAGRFKIPAVDDSLIYRLVALAKGHESQFVPKVDPSAGELEVSLQARDAAGADARRRIAGMILGEDGAPVPAAVISPEGAQIGSSTRWGGISRSVDPMAVTDEAGHFLLICKEEVDAIHALVEGLGFAQRWVALKPGRDHLIRVQEGATVTGRIVDDGKPVRDVLVGLVTTDRAAGNSIRYPEVATDNEGRFTIWNVTPEREFAAYVTMNSLRGIGAVPERVFTTGKTQTKLHLGDLMVQPGFQLSGRVALSDGKEIPPGTKLLLGREKAWDHAEALLDGEGRFEFKGVPRGRVGLNVRIRGYKCSKRNPNLDWLNGGLVGTVDGNITDLNILLDPGQWLFNGEEARQAGVEFPTGKSQQPYDQPLRGVKD